MFLRRLNKKGDGVTQVAKWLLYIAIVIAAGFAIVRVVGNYG